MTSIQRRHGAPSGEIRGGVAARMGMASLALLHLAPLARRTSGVGSGFFQLAEFDASSARVFLHAAKAALPSGLR